MAIAIGTTLPNIICIYDAAILLSDNPVRDLILKCIVFQSGAGWVGASVLGLLWPMGLHAQDIYLKWGLFIPCCECLSIVPVVCVYAQHL